MKKLISTLIAVAVVFSLAIPTLAAESPSSTSGQDVVTSASVVGAEGVSVDVSAPQISAEQTSSLDNVASAAASGEAYTVDVVDVELKDASGNVISASYFDTHDSVQIAFVRDNASQVIAVLYWNDATGTWDSAEFTQDGTNVTATFNHLCLISFVVKGTDPVAAAPADGTTASAQTGYETIVYTVVAIVALAGAGICFTASKKSAVSAV